MKLSNHRLAMLVIVATITSLANADDSIHISYSEPLQNVQLTTAHTPGSEKISAGVFRTLRFDAFSKRFDIQLESNRALLSAEQQNKLDPDIGIYRGKLAAAQDSWVRIVVVEGAPRGLIWDGEQMYAIDTKKGDAPVLIYRLKDVHVPDGALSCTHAGAVKNGAGLYQAIKNELAAATSNGPGATTQLDMAIIGDFEFTSAKGASVDADLIARINNVDGIFSSQLGVQLNVSRIDTFQTANDPFTDETSSSSLLDELADYRNATSVQNANGLSHLFTGRNLDGSTVGIAYGSAICSRRFGAGLTQGTHSLTFDSLIAAHEIGHNFGAPHDGTTGSVCESEPQTFLMAPSLNGSDQFSACSISRMQAAVSTASCLSALPSTDVAVVSGTQAPATLLGNSAIVTFAVNSVGTNSADSVSIDIDIPAAVSLTSISADIGTCTSGAASASCSIGAIAAGSGVNVTLDVMTIATGNADFTALISATVDANSNNNQVTTQLLINPAVDLALAAPAPVQLNLNQSTTIRPGISNQSTLLATGVTITVTPDAGLRIDSVSWSSGTCSLDSGVASCQAATLAIQSSSNLILGITGTSEGTLSYALVATVNEADRDTSNNSASGQVTVGGVSAPADDDGGGGAIGIPFAVLFGISCFVARRKRRPLCCHPIS
jgi:hypothetical protein